MADDRDELAPAQRLLNAAAALNEATYELITLAQLRPVQLEHLLAEACLACEDAGDETPIDAAVDKLAEAIDHLDHLLPGALPALAKAARAWTEGGR